MNTECTNAFVLNNAYTLDRINFYSTTLAQRKFTLSLTGVSCELKLDHVPRSQLETTGLSLTMWVYKGIVEDVSRFLYIWDIGLTDRPETVPLMGCITTEPKFCSKRNQLLKTFIAYPKKFPYEQPGLREAIESGKFKMPEGVSLYLDPKIPMKSSESVKSPVESDYEGDPSIGEYWAFGFPVKKGKILHRHNVTSIMPLARYAVLDTEKDEVVFLYRKDLKHPYEDPQNLWVTYFKNVETPNGVFGNVFSTREEAESKSWPREKGEFLLHFQLTDREGLEFIEVITPKLK